MRLLIELCHMCSIGRPTWMLLVMVCQLSSRGVRSGRVSLPLHKESVDRLVSQMVATFMKPTLVEVSSRVG
jgi:hypothetical protein